MRRRGPTALTVKPAPGRPPKLTARQQAQVPRLLLRGASAWGFDTERSRIEPMKKVARMLRSHRELLLHWFRAKGAMSSGTIEDFNNKARLTTRKAYGFRTFRAIEIALYHTLGALPEPEPTHRFC